MTPEMMVLSAIIVAAIVLFVFEVFPVDKVSLLVLGSIVVFGLITPEEAIAGFGNPATITIACMLALSFAIQQTGGLNLVANKLIDLAGESQNKVLVSIIAGVGFLSAFINNTAAVALFLPLTIAVSKEQKLDVSKLLMPMSFSAILAGTCTLIGTSTNLLVYSLVLQHLHWSIGIFEFAPLGIILFCAGSFYLLTFGRRLLPTSRRTGMLTQDYRLQRFVTELLLTSGSPLVGKTLGQSALGETYDVEVLEILRGKEKLLATEGTPRLRAGDLLLVKGDPQSLMRIQKREGVVLKAMPIQDRDLESENIVLAEAFVSPTSRLVGTTLKEIDFRRTYKANALAIRSHQGRTISEKIGKTRLEYGDSLLILTTREQLELLKQSDDFLVFEEVRVTVVRKARLYYTVGIFTAVVAAAALNVVTILEASIIGVGLMVLFGCSSLREIYNSMPWQTIIMLGCLIPLGTAMEKTGLAHLMAMELVGLLKDSGPLLVLSGIFLLTSLLTGFMSNNATAVLMFPIAVSVAEQLGVSPKPFVFAIMFAASASFMTPIGYQTNLFVFGPGSYRFSDFVRVGLPLNFLTWLLSTALIPYFWSF